MEQEITQNARRGQRFSVCIHGVNDKGENNARRRRKIWRYIRGETAKKHIFGACSELHFFEFYACLQGACSNA